jgi:hypothetical protein
MDTKTLARMHVLAGVSTATRRQLQFAAERPSASGAPHKCLRAVSAIAKAYPVSASTPAPTPIALLFGHVLGTRLHLGVCGGMLTNCWRVPLASGRQNRGKERAVGGAWPGQHG